MNWMLKPLGIEKGILKPLERFAYKKSRMFTNTAIRFYLEKYIDKFIKKRTKLGMGETIDSDKRLFITRKFVFILESSSDLSDSDVYTELKKFETAGSTNNTDRPSFLNRRRKQQVTPLNGTDDIEHCGSASSDGDDTNLGDRAFDVLPTKSEEGKGIVINSESLHEVIVYTIDLYRELRKNRGLDHGKVKEYWMFRGPRIFLLWTISITFIYVSNEILDPPTSTQRIKNAGQGIMLLLTALYMLYYRLPDSIDSACCRSAHDHYVEQKRIICSKAKSPKPAK
jgi:hypothetical protein